MEATLVSQLYAAIGNRNDANSLISIGKVVKHFFSISICLHALSSHNKRDLILLVIIATESNCALGVFDCEDLALLALIPNPLDQFLAIFSALGITSLSKSLCKQFSKACGVIGSNARD